MSCLSRPDRGSACAITQDEGGFTLVELLIVTVIVPVIIGALSLSLVSVFSLQTSVSSRLGDSANSQVVTTNFTTDIQGATQIITGASVAQCGTGTQILALQLGSGVYLGYDEVLQSGSLYTLVRNQCTNSGVSDTPGTLFQSTNLAYDVAAPCSGSLVTNCLTMTSYPSSIPTSSWTSTQGITSVVFGLYAPKSKYAYTISAEPLGADSTVGNLGTTSQGDSCGFALPGTGTYASQLCFFDFSKYFANGTVPNNTTVTEYVPGGYKLTATLSVTGQTNVVAAHFPTYSAAFLGNANNSGSPFYSGVGCPSSDPTTYVSGSQTYGTTSCISPAIYQQGSGTTTVTLSNITLTTVTGAMATGYEVVTADAETTDANESQTWTSNLGFNQVPDLPGGTTLDAQGNACSSTDANGNPVGGGDITPSTISNSTTVECGSTWQDPAGIPRTGTLILAVTPPSSGTGANGSTSIKDVMVGSGLEGVSFGLLLP
jgi:prepilin-type N-terminal cleavage/methylation domain-containing protein